LSRNSEERVVKQVSSLDKAAKAFVRGGVLKPTDVYIPTVSWNLSSSIAAIGDLGAAKRSSRN